LVKLSKSKVELWMHSERCFWWRYIRGLSRKTSSVELDRGELQHSALQYMYELGNAKDAKIAVSVDESVQAVAARLASVGDWYTMDRLFLMMDKYEPTLEEDLTKYTVVSAEEDISHEVSEGVLWTGVIDLTLQDRDGRIFYVDHKTTEKKVDSSYFSEKFNNDQQFTSYEWLGRLKHGDSFGGVLINGLQATSTIPAKFARFPISRDNWQTDEWLGTIRVVAPRIEQAYTVGKALYEEGLRETDDRVLAEFPIRYGYGENYCDYRHLNNAPPDFREATIKEFYDERQESRHQ
jgi:hypothetical protein